MTEKTTNVLSFPKKTSGSLGETKTNDEFLKKLEENKESHVDTVIEICATSLYNRLGVDGFDLEDEVFYNDFTYVVEALRSTLLRQCGISHPFQEYIDECEKEWENSKTESEEKSNSESETP